MRKNIEIKTLNKTERVKKIMIRKGSRYYYFKGEKMRMLLRWKMSDNIKLHWFINSLK